MVSPFVSELGRRLRQARAALRGFVRTLSPLDYVLGGLWLALSVLLLAIMLWRPWLLYAGN